MGSRPQLTAGDALAGYRIDALIGRGGMGEVYRARDPRLDRQVALKLIARERAGDEQFRARFLRESRLAASLDHPNVLPIYERGEADGRLFIAMRFVDGSDLQRLLRQSGRLAPARALALLAPVAAALDAAHARGLVHRDVKPANVLIASGDEHVYLSDFGLSTAVSEPGRTGVFSGTADYAAPELITGGRVDARADVYAFGCVLFECLTGTPPYRGTSVMGVLWGHVNDPVPSASERAEDLPRAIDPLFEKALAKDPAKRPETCRALLDQARPALGLGGAAALRAPRRALVALGLTAAVAIAAAALLWAREGEDPPAAAAAGAAALVRIDPATNAVAARRRVPGSPVALAARGGDVWAVDPAAGTVVRLERGHRTVRSESAHGVPSDVALAGDHAVVVNGADGTAALFDARSGASRGVVQLGGVGYTDASVATDGRWAWVASGRQLLRIDLVTQVVAATTMLAAATDDGSTGRRTRPAWPSAAARCG
jgi:serine/threonine-protein kinase